MTLNGSVALILRYFTVLGSFEVDCVEVVEDRPTLCATKCSPKNLVFSNISFIAIFAEVTENERTIEG